MAITKYSVDDYEGMIRLGVLTERDRVELIRGEIVPKMAIGPRHSTCVKGLNQLRLSGQPAGRLLASRIRFAFPTVSRSRTSPWCVPPRSDI